MQNVINLSVIIHLNNIVKSLTGILIANAAHFAIGIAPVYVLSLAGRRELDVLQITTYYSIACRPLSFAFDGGERSAYHEERRGREDHDGFVREGWSCWVHISRNCRVCFFSRAVKLSAISFQLPSRRKLLKWNLNVRLWMVAIETKPLV